MNIDFKIRFYSFLESVLLERIAESEKHLKNIQQDVIEESKGSAGDKHETGRAMAQIECEKAANVLKENYLQLEIFRKTDIKKELFIVQTGALVETTKGCFFISIGLGNFEIENLLIFCMGTKAPLAKELIGKKKGDSIIFRSEKITILSII